MTGESSYGAGSINFYAKILWAWTVASGLLVALFAANAYRRIDFQTGETTVNLGAGAIGFVVGALFTAPFWVLFGLGAHLARKLDNVKGVVRYEGKRASDAARDMVTVAAPGSADARGTATTGATSRAASDRSPYEPPATVEAVSTELATLLADDELRAQIARTRKIYGRKVAAESLTRKAQEAGYDGLVVTEDDLPADL